MSKRQNWIKLQVSTPLFISEGPTSDVESRCCWAPFWNCQLLLSQATNHGFLASRQQGREHVNCSILVGLLLVWKVDVAELHFEIANCSCLNPPMTDSLLRSGSCEENMLTAPFKSCWRPCRSSFQTRFHHLLARLLVAKWKWLRAPSLKAKMIEGPRGPSSTRQRPCFYANLSCTRYTKKMCHFEDSKHVAI